MPSTRPSPAGSLGDQRGHPRGHPGEPDAEQEHDHGDGQHQHPGHPGGQAHRRAEGAEQRAEDAEADDAPGVEGELGPHPRREGQSAVATAGGEGGGVRGGEAEHQAADHGHAGGDAGGDAQDEHEEQAAAARVGQAGREVGRAEDARAPWRTRGHGQSAATSTVRHTDRSRVSHGCGAGFVAGVADRGVEQVAVEGRVTGTVAVPRVADTLTELHAGHAPAAPW